MSSKIKAYGICLYKQEKETTKILLCKSVKSNQKWGFLKGVQESNELVWETAIREFYEESSIKVDKNDLEVYFEQNNTQKDIGVYLVDYDKIDNINLFFTEERLKSKFLSEENSKVAFFTLEKIPSIKKKQNNLVNKIIQYLASKRV